MKRLLSGFSLRFRINLVITLVVAVFTVATGNLLINETRNPVREEMEAGSRVTVQLLETVIANTKPAADGSHNKALLAFLQRVGRVRANEIRMYDENDQLIYTSPPAIYKQGRWAPRWFTSMVDPGLSEFRLNLPGGTVSITPDPSRSILDAWDDLKNFFWLVAGFFILVNVVVFWILGRSVRPIQTILDGLARTEQGRFDTRLPAFGLPEFDAIGRSFNRMAQTLEESLAENRRLALVARQSSDAIIIHDLEGRISFWNPAAERMFGYSTDEIVGQSATLLAPPERRHEIDDNLQVIRERKLIEMSETCRVTRDGRLVDVALSAAPLVDPDGDRVIGEIGPLAGEIGDALKKRWPQLVAVFFGHVADGNLHVSVRMSGHDVPELDIENEVYGIVARRRGSISAEHGIGSLKIPFLHFSRSEAEIELMRTLKKAMDPKGILNPGKLFAAGARH